MTNTTTPSLTRTQAQAINARIISRYQGLKFDTEGIIPNKSRNHQRGFRKSPKRKAIL